MRLSLRMRESANWAARSVTLKRGGGKALVGEQGETERELCLVPEAEVVEVRVGERGVSKVKLESNMLIGYSGSAEDEGEGEGSGRDRPGVGWVGRWVVVGGADQSGMSLTGGLRHELLRVCGVAAARR